VACVYHRWPTRRGRDLGQLRRNNVEYPARLAPTVLSTVGRVLSDGCGPNGHRLGSHRLSVLASGAQKRSGAADDHEIALRHGERCSGRGRSWGDARAHDRTYCIAIGAQYFERIQRKGAADGIRERTARRGSRIEKQVLRSTGHGSFYRLTIHRHDV